MKKTRPLRILTESAIMLALATVLSIFKLVELPYGGSITLASMLPVLIIAYRHGNGWGLLTGVIYGIIQQLLGLKVLSWVSTWQSVLAVVLLDYVVAFMVIGFGGTFRRTKSQPAGLCLGALLVCLLRYACHVISGATVWAGLSIPTKAALAYSFIYNATYMIPETIVLLIAAYLIGSKLDFRGAELGAYKGAAAAAPNALDWIGGLLIAGALIFDTAKVFAGLQNAETGEFDITGIAAANWTLIGIVTGVALVIGVTLLVISAAKKNKAAE